ncbi:MULTISPECIES: hypothetical protein [unclassified Streptomyces]|uniref:hypothetical protein n=1 Tax=unclassified Streptomyces TaxID=2593676 RepID=UPI000DC78B2C|nr:MULTISPECIES: hypothetical protein [unclassified Streptomyces]AWZ07718.1 hypothetical protein DRB89_27380 [Streptomyces sp. ICC4]AWZ12637.1 hypothetical protein DRB96_10240 [Streptomyces sp. ICC1]
MTIAVDRITAESAPHSRHGWNQLGDRLFAQALAVIDSHHRTTAELAAAELRLTAARVAWKRAENSPA